LKQWAIAMDTAIYICALSRLEDTVATTGARHVVSAINPWSIPATPANVPSDNHLKLAINDIDVPHPNLVHPEAHHIEQLVDFIQRWNRDGPLVVHCLAGISRSTASAFTAACLLNPEIDERVIAKNLQNASSTAQPNVLISRLEDAYLKRNGRMIAAIEALTPRLATSKAATFSIPSHY